MLYNKGAMFGLDARIALAIFGALSVISGAALYSAIQQSKIVALVNELQEAGKAYEAFILDTGEMLEHPGVNQHYVNALKLIDNSTNIKGWNGPYLSYEPGDAAYGGLDHPIYGQVRLAHIHNESWGSNFLGTCVTGKTCYAWAMINSIPNDIAQAMDVYIDGIANDSEGNFRIHDTGGTAPASHVYLKLFPTLTQP